MGSFKLCRKKHSPDFNNSGACRACVRINSRKSYKKNLSKRKAIEATKKHKKYRSEWRLKNYEKIRKSETSKKRKSYYLNWRIKNKTKKALADKQWRLKNWNSVLERTRGYCHKRRALKNRSSGQFSRDDFLKILKKQKYKCIYCKRSVRKKFHIDHRRPLSRGGSNGKRNIQITCPPCNLKKHAKTHKQFLKEII